VSGWLVFLLASAGHAEWWVIAVNRLHSFPISAHKLRRFRTVHDFAVPGFPLLLAAMAGFGEQGLLCGGSPADQPVTMQLLLACAASGCIPLLVGILRWQAFGRKAFLLADSRELIIVRDTNSTEHKTNSTEHKPAPTQAIETVSGLPKTLARIWPFNEFNHLELNRKSIRIVAPRTRNRPATSNDIHHRPLRLLHFSDLHFTGTPGLGFYREFVHHALQHPADAIFFTGDLIDAPELLPHAIEILRPLTQHAPCWFVLGNHDWRYEHEHVRRTLEKSGWICVAGNGHQVVLNGLEVFIAGSERPWMGNEPPIAGDISADLKVLLCHTPDGRTDAACRGYQLVLCGHTHGGQVVLPVIGPVYSPSITGVRFASGLFQWPDFVMHVSRGIGSKDPLRWNCPPEVTWLEVTLVPPAL
jgi:predicted MPP superfamily phosphohydrolase